MQNTTYLTREQKENIIEALRPIKNTLLGSAAKVGDKIGLLQAKVNLSPTTTRSGIIELIQGINDNAMPKLSNALRVSDLADDSDIEIDDDDAGTDRLDVEDIKDVEEDDKDEDDAEGKEGVSE